MADQKRIWRLGIDVGGTNTDAVVIDGDLKLVAATKSPTTEDVMSGIVARHARGDPPRSVPTRRATSGSPCWAPRIARTPSSSASA